MTEKQFKITKGMRSKNPKLAALAYARAGWPVLAVWGVEDGKCACGKPDCHSPGKHPIAEHFPNGVHDATTDINFIKRAFRKYPRANIAVALTELTVVDVDGRNGETKIATLSLSPTATSLTGRGHHHFFFGALPTGAVKLKELDLLTGANRYAIVPPSLHASGERYRWDRDCNTIASLPKSLVDLAKCLKDPVANNEPSLSPIIPTGQRNNTLFSNARSFRRFIDDEPTLLDVMAVINSHQCEVPLDAAELRALVKSSERYSEHHENLFGPPLTTNPLPMEWLWYPYIPRYGLTILAGDPGRGKSLLTAWLIGIVTSGRTWPFSSETSNGKRVLLLAAEDNWQRSTLGRLLKAGANIDNLHVMQRFRVLDGKPMDELEREIGEWKPVLIVIDTITAYMGGGRDMHRQNEVGEFLAKLNELAEASGAAILAIAHMNKQSTEHPLYRIIGSIAFVATVRSALFLGADPSDKSRPALAHGKANSSELGQTIIFEIDGSDRKSVPVIRAVEVSNASATDVCRVEKNSVGRPSSESDAAIVFVLDFLDDDPKPWRTVSLAAEVRCIASKATMGLVRAELAKSGQIIQVGKGRKAQWKLGYPNISDEG